MSSTPSSRFQKTSWTLVQAAAIRPTLDSRQALGLLCQTYWHPVFAFVRRNGYDWSQSQDLTQGFFALLLEKNYLLDADRTRGRFRSFLLTAVKHFLANQWDRAQALKRGGGQVPVSIDLVAAESWDTPSTVEPQTPESLFERRWALSLLEHVMVRLRNESAAAGRADIFDRLSVFLDRGSEAVHYEELAEEMGTTPGALRMTVLRLKRRYGKLLREEIRDTVATAADIDEEIRFLVSTLST